MSYREVKKKKNSEYSACMLVVCYIIENIIQPINPMGRKHMANATETNDTTAVVVDDSTTTKRKSNATTKRKSNATTKRKSNATTKRKSNATTKRKSDTKSETNETKIKRPRLTQEQRAEREAARERARMQRLELMGNANQIKVHSNVARPELNDTHEYVGTKDTFSKAHLAFNVKWLRDAIDSGQYKYSDGDFNWKTLADHSPWLKPSAKQAIMSLGYYGKPIIHGRGVRNGHVDKIMAGIAWTE